MFNDTRPIVIKNTVFKDCAYILGYLVVRHIKGCHQLVDCDSTDCRKVIIETNRLQRRELLRHGVSYCEYKGE